MTKGLSNQTPQDIESRVSLEHAQELGKTIQEVEENDNTLNTVVKLRLVELAKDLLQHETFNRRIRYILTWLLISTGFAAVACFGLALGIRAVFTLFILVAVMCGMMGGLSGMIMEIRK